MYQPMKSLFGNWISGDGFSLKLQRYPSGRIGGVYQTSLPGSRLSLAFHGVSLNQNGQLTFAAVVECRPCQSMGWAGEITLHGSVDQAHSRMRVKWIATSGLARSETRPKMMSGSTVMLRFPYYFHWKSGFNSEIFAPHTLLVQEHKHLHQVASAGVHDPSKTPRKRRRF